MKTIHIRKGSQLFFLTLFIITVFQATYPFSPWLPPELFLWFDPFIGPVTMLVTRTWIPWFFLGLIVFLSPLLVGRAFCGWVCPLGTTIDAGDHLFAPRKDKTGRKYSSWKFKILAFLFVSALFGSNLAWWLDPMSILWRTFGAVIIPLLTTSVHGFFNTMLELRLAEDLMYDSFDALTRSLIPVKPMIVHGAILTAGIFSGILILSRISKRFWCRVLCPLGALLGIVSKFSPLQRLVKDETCTDCSLCRRDCKMGAINGDFVTTEKAECIFCMNCAEVCETKGTTFTFQPPQKMLSPLNVSRREFFGLAGTGLATAALLRINYNPENTPAHCIRPPGSVLETDFIDRCIRCNECVRICASTGACLQPLYFESGLEGFFTPHADFQNGYCEYSCNLCGEICPTGAIQQLEIEEKKKWKMGLAIFDTDVCIPFRENENCLVCEEHCPTPEKAIWFEKKEYFDQKSGQTREVLYPKILNELCIGCGICQEKCPIEGVPGVYVKRVNEYAEI